jgi:hypothetical protein
MPEDGFVRRWRYPLYCAMLSGGNLVGFRTESQESVWAVWTDPVFLASWLGMAGSDALTIDMPTPRRFAAMATIALQRGFTSIVIDPIERDLAPGWRRVVIRDLWGKKPSKEVTSPPNAAPE